MKLISIYFIFNFILLFIIFYISYSALTLIEFNSDICLKSLSSCILTKKNYSIKVKNIINRIKKFNKCIKKC